jgi:hypothetical protein
VELSGLAGTDPPNEKPMAQRQLDMNDLALVVVPPQPPQYVKEKKHRIRWWRVRGR